MRSNSITREQLTSWILVTLRESSWAPLSVIGFYLFGLVFHLFWPISAARYPHSLLWWSRNHLPLSFRHPKFTGILRWDSSSHSNRFRLHCRRDNDHLLGILREYPGLSLPCSQCAWLVRHIERYGGWFARRASVDFVLPETINASLWSQTAHDVW